MVLRLLQLYPTPWRVTRSPIGHEIIVAADGREILVPQGFDLAAGVVESVGIIACLERLRANEGATVTFLCDNPDFDMLPDRTVVVCDDWTGWEDRRFGGNSLLEALQAAEAERKRLTGKGK